MSQNGPKILLIVHELHELNEFSSWVNNYQQLKTIFIKNVFYVFSNIKDYVGKFSKSKITQNYPKNLYIRQPYSEADRSSNARSELKTIINYKEGASIVLTHSRKGRAANGGDEGKKKGNKRKEAKEN